MRVLSKFLPIFLAFITATSSARGDNAALERPSPDHIRKHYQEAAVSWPEIPRSALVAIVAAEDRLFFERPSQISAITHQIGRWYLEPGAGRLRMMALPFVIGEALTHDEVLSWYANQVFLGQTCFGLSGAAMAYFGKPIRDLRLEEVAFLAALPKAPVLFHPVRAHDRALERRNFVLSEMARAGFISDDEAERAIETSLVVRLPLERCEPLE